MSQTTILQYLTERNPVLDNRNSLKGTLTFNERWPVIDQCQDWRDFTFETLMSCYGDVLRASLPQQGLGVSPPLTALECEIWDEDSLDHLLSRAIMPQVSKALARAWDACYQGIPHPIDITRGGRARKPNQNVTQHQSSESNAGKAFPDWAGVKRVATGRPEFKNYCPGDTKLSSKWQSTDNPNVGDYFRPIAQVLYYGGNHWNTRYGYVITQSELVVLRFSREPIGPGLASGRSPRAAPSPGRAITAQTARVPDHQRGFSASSHRSAMSIDQQQPGQSRSRQTSIASVTSSVGGMSISGMSSGSVYDDSRPDSEYNPVEMKSIPWTNSGQGKLTVKLALWWIHMMAGAPGANVEIKNDYPPLASEKPGRGPSPPGQGSTGGKGKAPSSRGPSPPGPGSSSGKGKAPVRR